MASEEEVADSVPFSPFPPAAIKQLRNRWLSEAEQALDEALSEVARFARLSAQEVGRVRGEQKGTRLALYAQNGFDPLTKTEARLRPLNASLAVYRQSQETQQRREAAAEHERAFEKVKGSVPRGTGAFEAFLLRDQRYSLNRSAENDDAVIEEERAKYRKGGEFSPERREQAQRLALQTERSKMKLEEAKKELRDAEARFEREWETTLQARLYLADQWWNTLKEQGEAAARGDGSGDAPSGS
jgi:hypothetical protein